ncbi:MAG TPA: sigma-70 family RNA polymerase sigma factor [Saprospiraceae bacterium]|nr:sigma-70 family RNA polymerase sigma factor [Saprospiraceae bacterium]HPN72072.1 sigma-70 family RNA polymerase sigma factor [Saprospiraceae bacterium]
MQRITCIGLFFFLVFLSCSSHKLAADHSLKSVYQYKEDVPNPNSDLASKNFNLSQQTFEELLEALQNGDNQLFKQAFLAQANDVISNLKSKYKAEHNDAYDAFLDTLLVFRSRMLDGKVSYGNLRFLLLQMSSQHYLRMVGKKTDELTETAMEFLQDEEDEKPYNEQQLEALERAFKKLNELCSELLLLNYYQGLKLSAIAEKLERSPDAVRKQKERCKQSLIELFNKEYHE